MKIKLIQLFHAVGYGRFYLEPFVNKLPPEEKQKKEVNMEELFSNVSKIVSHHTLPVQDGYFMMESFVVEMKENG